jgi:hypothetical protein
MRAALLVSLRSRWKRYPGTLIVPEFGTHYGSGRADVAVVNGSLWGYEIKSNVDRLSRLAAQATRYNEVFDYAILVAAPRHVAPCLGLLPKWWGLIEAREGETGAVELIQRRRPKRNDATCQFATAALLWRSELLDLLEEMDAASGLRAATRAELVEAVVGEVGGWRLRSSVRDYLKARQDWRDDLGRMQDAGRSLPEHMSSGFLARRIRQQRRTSTDRLR